MLEKTLSHRGRCFSKEGDDEDIPRHVPSSPLNDDQTIATNKGSTDDIRMGPIMRARAKLLEQQVNLFLIKPDVFINGNFILPKSWCVCILRFEEEGIVREGEELGIWRPKRSS
jgi:hypothetical protein